MTFLASVRPAVVVVVLGLGACATSPARGRTTAPATAHDSVTVAYGRVSREHLTGAVGSITEDDIAALRVQRVEQLLQGRLAGVQVMRGPGNELTIRIRGTQGLGYSNDEPLIVLDGMPTQGRGLGSVLDGLAPQDIARIDVLKDAGSTAAYGVRGANGVILITTKRGGRD
jgi:TonB-dependent SusC/RagA subfamily outer membrane receptor